MGTSPEVIEAPERRLSPALIMVLVVLLIVVAVVLFLVLSPDEEPIAQPPPASTQRTSPSPSPSPSPAPPETFEVFEARDPFRPLVVAAAGGTPASSTISSGPGTGTTTGGTPAPAPTGSGQRVTLVDVFDDAGTTKAQVKVGSTVYTVVPGEVFADNFKLVSISGTCGTFLHGDDKFTLCEGEEIIK